MAKITVGPTWQVFTDGTNSGLLAAEGGILLYVGAAAPAATEPGIPFRGEKVQVGAPAKSWVRTSEATPVTAIQMNW